MWNGRSSDDKKAAWLDRRLSAQQQSPQPAFPGRADRQTREGMLSLARSQKQYFPSGKKVGKSGPELPLSSHSTDHHRSVLVGPGGACDTEKVA